MALVHRPHVENFIRWSADRPDVLVMGADLTNSSEVGRWRDTYPERFISAGMAEQNMLGVAGGLAREGFEPWLHTFAVFLYRRPYDQLAMSVAYPNLRVRLVGFLPGLVTPGGVTHQAIEDVAVMRATPNMTVLETGDATEVESVLEVSEQIDGPLYIRMLRGEIPRLFPADQPLRYRCARELSVGEDVTVLSSGVVTEEAMRATRVLRDRGVGVTHVHVSTLKPFGDDTITAALHRARRAIITLENHTIVGGLGSAVAEVIAEQGLGVPLRRLGLRDTYAHGASKEYLLHAYGLDALALVRAVEEQLGEHLDVTEEEVRAVDVEAASEFAKADAL